MTTSKKIAAIGLATLALAGFVAPASAQNVCINRPAISLTDTTTDNAEALQRIDSLGNRCVEARATGEDVTRTDVIRFMESERDTSDTDYMAVSQ